MGRVEHAYSQRGSANTSSRVAALGRRPVLVVGESPGALGRGAMINFVHEDRRVRFEVDLDTLERSGLGVSSRLLTVARTVTSRRPG